MASEQMTEEERDIAESMLYELWEDRQHGQGGYSHKKHLVSCTHLGNPPDLTEQVELRERVYQQLVKEGCIHVNPNDETRCALGDNVNVSISISY